MNKEQLRSIAANAYEKLVRGRPYLVLLIACTVSIALSVIGNGIYGIVGQILPLLTLIGLYIARSGNRTGVKMVRICASIEFWIYCIMAGVLLIVLIAGVIGSLSDNGSQSAGVFGMLIGAVIIGLQFFFPIFYFRDIRLITTDIEGWFIGTAQDGASDRLPETSRRRVSCKLIALCVVQLVINGITALYLLSMYSRSSLVANIGGGVLNQMTDSNMGTQLVGLLMPSVNIFMILASAAVIAKYVCVIVLYRQYREVKFVQEAPKPPVPDPIPQPEPKHAPRPVERPQPEKRSVKIILERKSPRSGRFSARMTSEMTVGRKEEANIVLPDDQAISGRHMKLFIRNNKLYAEDLNSHNGVYVNGRKITGTEQIHRGDEIRLGNSEFILTWET